MKRKNSDDTNNAPTKKQKTNEKEPKRVEVEEEEENDKNDVEENDKNDVDEGDVEVYEGEDELVEMTEEEMRKIWEKNITNAKVREPLINIGCIIRDWEGERDNQIEGLNIELKEPLMKILFDVLFPMNLVYVDKDKDQENPWDFMKGGEIGISTFDDEIMKEMKRKNVSIWMWKFPESRYCAMFDLESKDPTDPSIVIYDIKEMKEVREVKFSDFLAELEPMQFVDDDGSDDGNPDNLDEGGNDENEDVEKYDDDS